MTGPLNGIRVVEIAGPAPSAFGAMILADLGADVLVESLRPGVAERLGFGPEETLERNPRLRRGSAAPRTTVPGHWTRAPRPNCSMAGRSAAS